MKRLLYLLIASCSTAFGATNYIGNYVSTNTAATSLQATDRLLGTQSSDARSFALTSLATYFGTSPTFTGALTLSGVTGPSTNLYNLQQNVLVNASGHITAEGLTLTGAGASVVDELIVTNGVQLLNVTPSRAAIYASDGHLTNDVAATGTGAPVRAADPALTGNPTAPTASANDNDTSIATTAFVTGSTVTFTGKTFNAADTGNILKQTKYADLLYPGTCDGVGAIMNTNNNTSRLFGHATFSGSQETNNNYVIFQWAVPEDIDTGVAMTAKLYWTTAGTGTQQIEWRMSYLQTDDTDVVTTAMTSFTSPIPVTDTPASVSPEDLFISDVTTLTGWASALNAGRFLQICVARVNNTNDDALTLRMVRLAYGSVQ